MSSKDLLSQVSKEKLVELLTEQRDKAVALEKLLNEVHAKGNKATESQLDNLQGHLADVMSEQVMYKDAIIEYNEEGEAVEGEERFTATPALLGVIRSFLNDNKIITNISTNENLQNLQNTLNKKKKHSDTLPSKAKVVNLMEG